MQWKPQEQHSCTSICIPLRRVAVFPASLFWRKAISAFIHGPSAVMPRSIFSCAEAPIRTRRTRCWSRLLHQSVLCVLRTCVADPKPCCHASGSTQIRQRRVACNAPFSYPRSHSPARISLQAETISALFLSGCWNVPRSSWAPVSRESPSELKTLSGTLASPDTFAGTSPILRIV